MGSTIIRTIDPDALNELANRRGWVKTKYTGLSAQQKKFAAFISQKYVATPAGIMSFIKFRQIWNNNAYRREIAFAANLYSWLQDHEINNIIWWRKFGDHAAIVRYEWFPDSRMYRMVIDSNADEDSEKPLFNHLKSMFIKENVIVNIDSVSDAFKTIALMDALFKRGKPNMVIKRHVYTLPDGYFV